METVANAAVVFFYTVVFLASFIVVVAASYFFYREVRGIIEEHREVRRIMRELDQES